MARGRFNFYLNFQKDDELLVAERIDDLKRRRSFTSVVREGIIIISELREGRVDTLLRLYPWIVDAIRPTPPPSDSGDLKNEISLLRKLILEQGTIKAPPDNYPQMKQLGAGIGSTLGKGKLMALPTFDDDEDMPTLVLSKSTKATSNGANLMSSMFSLEQ